MPSPFRNRIPVACSVLALCYLSRSAVAQQVAATPHAGEWAAEAGIAGQAGSAALLHFSSASRAWLFGFTSNVEHISSTFALGQPRSASVTLVEGQVGTRFYRSPNAGLRPYWGLGLTGQISRATDVHLWGTGAYGELGAAYLLTPHFSVGADGRLEGAYQHTTGAQTQTEWIASFNLVRLAATVYF